VHENFGGGGQRWDQAHHQSVSPFRHAGPTQHHELRQSQNPFEEGTFQHDMFEGSEPSPENPGDRCRKKQCAASPMHLVCQCPFFTSPSTTQDDELIARRNAFRVSREAPHTSAYDVHGPQNAHMKCMAFACSKSPAHTIAQCPNAVPHPPTQQAQGRLRQQQPYETKTCAQCGNANNRHY
jgi:hypothetical protein